MKNSFEAKFREVVFGLGGQGLPQTETESADFLFSDDDVIVELKTLMADARRDHDEKLKNLSNEWMKRGLLVVYGKRLIRLRELNPICQREWLDVLQPPIEAIVSKANSQIRSSKLTLNRESAKGVLLVANDGNFLPTQPLDYMNLVGRVLQKKTREGLSRFPHIDGVVYFSYRIPSEAEKLPFWVDGTVKNPPALEPELSAFHEKLKQGWYNYQSRVTGLPVVELLASPQP